MTITCITRPHWRPASTPPAPLEDVLLYQELHDLGEGDDHLIRIGYLNRAGVWVDSYSSTLDGSDDVLHGITHWAMLPAGPDSEVTP